MNGNEYQDLAMRTNDSKSGRRLEHATKEAAAMGYDLAGLLNGLLGLSGETGEFTDMIKKWIFHEANLDVEHAKKELGDVMWYVAMICHSMNWDLDEIMRLNINKLMRRYPEGFNIVQSEHRKAGDV